jgi:putative ABC transport system ATP-binding protein
MLRVDGLIAGYDGKPVVGLPSLSVSGGEVNLLLGASGSGKTTLLLAMAGLAEVISGRIDIDGVDLSQLSAAKRDRFRGLNIGFVFQELNLIPGLSALQNLLLAPFAASAHQDRKRALSLLEALGLGAVARRSAESLSLGQAQRVAIARAMLMRPKLILADEPTASLDAESCRVVATLLGQAAAETGAALVIATHDDRLRSIFPSQTLVESMR